MKPMPNRTRSGPEYGPEFKVCRDGVRHDDPCRAGLRGDLAARPNLR
jgi:hypothetical protein